MPFSSLPPFCVICILNDFPPVVHGYAVPTENVLKAIHMKTLGCLETLLGEDKIRIDALTSLSVAAAAATMVVERFAVMRHDDLDGRLLLSRIIGLDCVKDPAAIETGMPQAHAKGLKRTQSKEKLDSTRDRERAENFAKVSEDLAAAIEKEPARLADDPMSSNVPTKRALPEDLKNAAEAVEQLQIRREALPNNQKKSLDDEIKDRRRDAITEDAKVFWSDNRESLGDMSQFRDVVHLVGENAVTKNSSNAFTLAFLLTDQLRRDQKTAAADSASARSSPRVTTHHLVYLSYGTALLKAFRRLLEERLWFCFDTKEDREHFHGIIVDVLEQSKSVDFKDGGSVRIESGSVTFELHPGLRATTNSVREGMAIGGVAFINFRRLQTILRGTGAGEEAGSARPAAFITAQRKAESTVLSLAAASCNGTVLFMRHGGTVGDSVLRHVNMSAMHKMEELGKKLGLLWNGQHLIAAKRLIDAEAGLFHASTDQPLIRQHPHLDANAVLTGMYVAWDRLQFEEVAAKQYAPTMRASEQDDPASREPSRTPSAFTASAQDTFGAICDAHQNAAKDMFQLTVQRNILKNNTKLDESKLPTCAHIRALIRSSADIAVAEKHYTTPQDGKGGPPRPPRTLLPYWELMQ